MLSTKGLLIVGGALLLAIAVQSVRVHTLQADLRAERARVGALELANAQCSADVTAQNVAVEAWQAVAQAQASEAAKAVVEAEKRAVTHENRADGLRLRPPAIEGDACESARLLLADEVRERRK